MSLEVPLSQQGRCAVHPEELAGGTCTRCGNFVCSACATLVPALGAQVYCQACAARPELNYLEALRLRYWGKRDGSTWMVGLVALLLCLGVTLAFVGWGWGPTRQNVFLLLLLTPVPVCGAFFLGQRWARRALLAVPLGLPVALNAAEPDFRFLFVLCAMLGLLIALNIYRDPRNQLFFRLPVPSAKLQALWHQRFNNPLARQALNLGLGALFVPVFAPFAIICGAVGLARVNPKATPPIGRGGQAVAGLVLGVFSLMVWGLALLPALSRFASNFVYHQ
jgi:hypothetical protein